MIKVRKKTDMNKKERLPCIIEKPSLSYPPVILKTYPLNSSPRESAGTSSDNLLSKKTLLNIVSIQWVSSLDNIEQWGE